MQTAGDFLVYSCPSCDKRIFTQKRYQGRHGACPLCGDSHLVGGAPEVLLADDQDEEDGATLAEEAPDRRGSKRVRPRHSQGVEVRPVRQSTGRPLARGESLDPLLDISKTGVGFLAHGVPDSRILSGWRPPDYKVGDAIALTLHSSKINVRPRSFRAIVRRVEPTKKRGTYRVGAEFMGLGPEDLAFLRDLLR